MKRWQGTRAQQEAARAAAAERRASPHDESLNDYLSLELHRLRQAATTPPNGHPGGTQTRRRAWMARSRVPTRQEHLTLAGHNVAATEDEVGVVELHLE